MSRLVDQLEFRCGGLSEKDILQLYNYCSFQFVLNCYSKSNAGPRFEQLSRWVRYMRRVEGLCW